MKARKRTIEALRRLAERPGTPQEGAAARQMLEKMLSPLRRAPQTTIKCPCAICGISMYGMKQWRTRKYCGRKCYAKSVSIRLTKRKFTREQLRVLYWDRDLSLKDIAKLAGVDKSTVHVWMLKLKLDGKAGGRRALNRCRVQGCKNQVHLWRTSNKGYKSGSMCLEHFRENNRQKSLRCRMKRRGRTVPWSKAEKSEQARKAANALWAKRRAA